MDIQQVKMETTNNYNMYTERIRWDEAQLDEGHQRKHHKRISAGDMEMAHYEHAITVPYAQPNRTPTSSMNTEGAKIPIVEHLNCSIRKWTDTDSIEVKMEKTNN